MRSAYTYFQMSFELSSNRFPYELSISMLSNELSVNGLPNELIVKILFTLIKI